MRSSMRSRAEPSQRASAAHSCSASSEFGGSSSDEILVEKGFQSDRTIGLNARYFLEVVNVIDDEKARLIVEEGLRPLTIIEKNPDFTYTHMVMPLRI